MLRGSLEVIRFEPRQVIADVAPPAHPCKTELLLIRRPLENRTVASCASALAVLSLHALLIAPALWGDGSFRPPQNQRHGGDTALQWVVLDDTSGNSAIAGSTSRPPLTMRAIGLTDALPTPPTLPLQASNRQSEGQSGLSAMSGRYLAQIRARIKRAWLRPRTAIGDPIFQCQVQMDQDSTGRVLAITLVECNGSIPWQLSLVHAIEAASPLPAPPNPAVFVHHILLTFRAMLHLAGASDQHYEPPRSRAADESPYERDAQPRRVLRALTEGPQAPSAKGVTFRIEGSKVNVEPQHR